MENKNTTNVSWFLEKPGIISPNKLCRNIKLFPRVPTDTKRLYLLPKLNPGLNELSRDRNDEKMLHYLGEKDVHICGTTVVEIRMFPLTAVDCGVTAV